MKQLSLFLARALIVLVLLNHAIIARADWDHDEAKRLLESSDILSLEVILTKLRPRYPGKILDVELETKSDRIIYEVEIVGSDGVVHELYINAKTGCVVKWMTRYALAIGGR
jgi:uncharacterized membrane protein YkoI